MKLIPAVDLQQELVVHARGGQRRLYRPVCTERFPDAAPLKLIERLIERLDCDTIYLADLNAIQRQGDNRAVIAQIRDAFPQLTLWLDEGVCNRQNLATGIGAVPIVGTETLDDDVAHFKGVDYILSLDFNDGDLAVRDILERSDEWPQTVIALSLDAVGAKRGPDLKTLRAVRARHDGVLIAGGGVRDQGDLDALAAIGINGALVATAIYEGKL